MKILAAVALLLAASSAQAVIFGRDDRVSYSQMSPSWKIAADGVALWVSKTALKQQPDGTFDLDTVDVSENLSLCANADRMFRKPGFYVGCTGFLVGEDTMMTAGHCMINFGSAEKTRTPHCENFVWIFDYHEKDGSVRTKGYTADQVYGCASVEKVVFDPGPDAKAGRLDFGQDWAITKLERKTSRAPLPVAFREPLPAETLTMLGHPFAGPLIQSKGRLLSTSTTYFRTNIDAFDGNSGSPVFGADRMVIGVFVRAFPDSIVSPPNKCGHINRCDDSGRVCEKKDADGYAHGAQVQKLDSSMPLPPMNGIPKDPSPLKAP